MNREWPVLAVAAICACEGERLKLGRLQPRTTDAESGTKRSFPCDKPDDRSCQELTFDIRPTASPSQRQLGGKGVEGVRLPIYYSIRW